MSIEATRAVPAPTSNAIARLGRQVACGIAGIVAAISAHKQRRATFEILRALDDRTLRDIGIDRGEIARAMAENARRYAGSASAPFPMRK